MKNPAAPFEISMVNQVVEITVKKRDGNGTIVAVSAGVLASYVVSAEDIGWEFDARGDTPDGHYDPRRYFAEIVVLPPLMEYVPARSDS